MTVYERVRRAIGLDTPNPPTPHGPMLSMILQLLDQLDSESVANDPVSNSADRVRTKLLTYEHGQHVLNMVGDRLESCKPRLSPKA